MGFGLLLAGYFTPTFLSFGGGDYAFAFYAVGGAVSFIAAGKLYEYKHRFGITVATSLRWIALGVYGAVAFLGEVFLWELPLPGMDATVPNFAFLLSWCIRQDCCPRRTALRAVGAEKVKSAIPWDAGILGMWAVGQVILSSCFRRSPPLSDSDRDQNRPADPAYRLSHGLPDVAACLPDDLSGR